MPAIGMADDADNDAPGMLRQVQPHECVSSSFAFGVKLFSFCGEAKCLSLVKRGLFKLSAFDAGLEGGQIP